MKKKLISMLIVAVMLVSIFGITPALAVGSAAVTFSGPDAISPGQTYTYSYTLRITNACAANANISVGGAFEKVSGGENLFYDTIPQNTTGTVSGTIIVRVKSDAALASTGTISVLTDESKCSELVFDQSGNVVGDPVISTVTGSISVRVGPAVTSAPSVTFVSGDKLQVQWNAVAGAGGYQVFRATSASGPYACVDTVAGTSALSTGLSPNTTYYFKIRAFCQTEPNNPIFGEMSAYGSGATRPLAPSAPSVTFVSGDKLQVQWNAVAGAGGYQVFRATSASGPFSCVDTTAATTSLSSGLSPNTTYYFQIRAFYQSEPNNPIFGEMSAYGSGATRPLAPSAPSVTFVSGDKLQVQWNAVAGAGGYQVFRATSASGPFSCVDTTAATTSLSSGLSPNTTYYFQIRAFYQSEPNNPIFGEMSAYGYGATRPSAPSAPIVTSVASNKLQVQWNAVAGAGGYQVFRATSASGPFSCVDTTAATTSLSSGLSPNTTYYFQIRAFYQSEPNNPIFGGMSAYGYGTTQAAPPGPAAPAAPIVTSVASDKLQVQWNAVAGAGGYQVFRATSVGGPYACVDTTAAATSLSSGLSPNTTYYFQIRAFYQTEPDNPIFGEMSAYGYGTTQAAPPGPAAPAAPTVTSVASDKLQVQWNAVAGAGGYQVFRATSVGGPYACVDTTAATTSLSSGLSPNTTYYFQIRAFYQTEPDNPIFGEMSAYGYGTTQSGSSGPAVPTTPTVTSVASDKLQVQWNAVAGAGGYQVFRATSAGGSYDCIDTVAGTSCLATGLSPNTTYYFKIRAFSQTEPNNPVFGEMSAYGSGTTQSGSSGPAVPATPTVTSVASDKLQVQWNAVAGAGGYQVFRATSASGSYDCIDTVAGTSCLATGLSPNTTYYFKIRAFSQTQPNNPVFGDFSDYGSGTTQG